MGTFLSVNPAFLTRSTVRACDRPACGAHLAIRLLTIPSSLISVNEFFGLGLTVRESSERVEYLKSL
jgi:hypothetical protein